MRSWDLMRIHISQLLEVGYQDRDEVCWPHDIWVAFWLSFAYYLICCVAKDLGVVILQWSLAFEGGITNLYLHLLCL